MRARLRAAAPAWLVFTAVGCSAAPERHAAPAPAATQAPAQSAPSARAEAPSARANPSADAVVADALELVARVRLLAKKASVPGVRMNRDALRAEVTRLMHEETPPEAIAANAEILFALDTVPAGFELDATLVRLYGAELAGFYDPKSKRMVLATDLGKDAERMTLYHELVHALQDQHFDLERAFAYEPESSDVDAALHAVAEGDATSAMTDVFAAALGVPAPRIPPGALKLDELMLQASPALAGVPAILARSMVAPYADGLAFVGYVREHAGGWPGVDSALAHPPLSTEQVLHPEKFVAHEPVLALPPPAAPSGFDADGFRDVMGEQGLRLLFEEWQPVASAASAAGGWGGDRLALFTNGKQRVVRWHLAFDSDADAAEAWLALVRGALRPEESGESSRERVRPFVSAKAAADAARGDRVCRARAQRGPFALVRHGRHIGVTLGPYERSGQVSASAGDCPFATRLAAELATQH